MRAIVWILQIALLVQLAGRCDGYRILGFFPLPMTSHQNVFAPILYELAARGHHVVYLTPVQPKLTHPNLDVRLINNFIKEFLDQVDLKYFGSATKPLASHSMSSAGERLADRFYGHPEAQKIIHGSEKYDAVLLESHFVQEPVAALMHKFGCVGVEIGTMGDVAWLNELAGLPDNPSYQVDFKSGLTDTLGFFDRVRNWYISWGVRTVSYYHLWRKQAVMDRYFNYTGWETRPPIHKIVSNWSMVLVNQDVVTGYPYPMAPHVKNIGGLNILPNRPLPKDIQEIMDTAEDGVIYFSFGSNLQTSEIAEGSLGEAFMNAFREIPQKILMKWEAEIIPSNLPKNVYTFKWLPQQDILAHNNCRVFITHGGYQSLTESAYHGVPLLGIPFFADQPKNMKHVVKAGYGIMLNYENVTKTSVSWALKEILTNQRYKNEAKRRSEMSRDKRHTGIDEAVYWIEYAIKYPYILTPRSAYMSFVELYMLDVYLFASVCTYVLWKVSRTLLALNGPQPKKAKC